MEDNQQGLLGRSFFWLYAAILVFTLAFMAVSFPAGFYTFFYTHLSSSALAPGSAVTSFPVYLAFAAFTVPIHATYGQVFIVLWVLYLSLFAIAALECGGFIRAVRNSLQSGFPALMRNPLAGTMLVLGAATLASVLLDTLQTSAGIPTGGISGDPFQLMMSLTVAPAVEEFGYRFFLIGAPLFIALLLWRSPPKTIFKSLWRPSCAWEGETATQRPRREFTYFLVFLSSLLFGLAHFLSGAGWDIGKVSTAALAGVALGYLYVRYGLHASILYHWGVDYFGEVFSFLAQGVWNIPWASYNGSVLNLLPALDVLILVGAPALSYFSYRLIMRFLESSFVGAGAEMGAPATAASSVRVIKPRRQAAEDDCNRQVDPL